MGPILSSLVNLQMAETRVRNTRKELRRGQQIIRKQQKKVDDLTDSLQAKKEDIRLTRLQVDRLDLELKTHEAEIARLRLALNSSKTNKEYSAALSRINTDRADNAKLEDQILTLMTQIDNEQALSKEIQEKIQEENQKLEEIDGKVRQQHQQVDDKLSQQQQELELAYEQVPQELRQTFQRLAERYDGEVLAEVHKLNGPKGDYSCEGCYMKVPLEMVNSLMSKDDVLICPNCGRVLVLDSKPKQQPIA